MANKDIVPHSGADVNRGQPDRVILTVRLTREEHSKFKVFLAKRRTNIQDYMRKHVIEISRDEQTSVAA